ncbi:MAG: 16S rRNA (cytidine(1402)-2'-O)-methyltransferase [Pseudomonadota bacterium]
MSQGNDLDKKSKHFTGLYLVATPIGTLADITLHALEVLKNVDVIACEDTRVTQKLLHHYGIDIKLFSYHDHNAPKVRPKLLQMLAEGQSIALVSDAGTPLIADPGYQLVKACYAKCIPVTSAPGACSPIVALTLSGLSTNRFCFAGFIPTKSQARQSFFEQFNPHHGTLIFFETAKRLLASLQGMQNVWPNTQACVARELTKKFEEVRTDTLPDLIQHYERVGAPRGEVIVLVDSRTFPQSDNNRLDELLAIVLKETTVRDGVNLVADISGLPRREVYQRALQIR